MEIIFSSDDLTVDSGHFPTGEKPKNYHFLTDFG